MRRFVKQLGSLATTASFALLTLGGCGGGTPSVSGSNTEVTVHGVVKYKDKPVKDGEIQFDPGNISRRDAKAVTAPIGPDGTYTIKTLYGQNAVSFRIPSLPQQDLSLVARSYSYDAPSGDSTYDIELNNP